MIYSHFPNLYMKKKTEGKRYIYFPKYASLRSDNLVTQIQVCVSSRHMYFSTPPAAFQHSKHLLEIIPNFKSKLSNEFVNEPNIRKEHKGSVHIQGLSEGVGDLFIWFLNECYCEDLDWKHFQAKSFTTLKDLR